MEEVINRIKEIRKEKGISHEAMAFDLGISQVAYSKIEKNETKLTLERLYKIADILESKISDILGFETQKIYRHEFKDNSQNYQEIQNLHATIGRLTVERDFLADACKRAGLKKK